MAATPNCTTIVGSPAGLSSTRYTPAPGLETGTVLYGRVRASNGCGEGRSPVWRFTTEAAPGDCNAGSFPNVLLSADFESGSAGWTHDGTGDSWTLASGQGRGGSAGFQANDPAGQSDQRLVSPSVALPLNEQPLSLRFWNFQSLESNTSGCWDGGLLEISTDDGSIWTQIESELLTDPYDGLISPGFDNPLGGMNGWCGDPQDWLNSIVDLSSYAGQTVQFRFRLGSDSLVAREGWLIDDGVVQSCQQPAAGRP